MKIFDENIKVIEQYRDNLYEFLKENHHKSECTDSNIERIESVQTRDGIASIKLIKGMETYRFNSFYHPVLEADTWIESCDLKGIGKVISIFGFGNGLYIRKLLEKIDKQDIVLVYEPSLTIFKHVLEHYDIKDILKDKRLLIAIESINKEEYRQSLQAAVYWSNLFSQRRYVLPQYDRAFSKSYEEFIGIIKANNDRAVMFRNSDSLFGRIVVENTFENLKYINKCNILSDYVDRFPEDVPAIIVSAGPSLDKNIEELKKVNKRAVIFGIDRSLEYLYNHGIEPDFAVTVDPLKPIKYFAGKYKVTVPLFAELHSNQQILDVHEGNKIFYNAFGYINTVLDKFDKKINPNISIGTSVATATFALCIAMKFKRIMLIGQDLAYSESGNSTHAGGINTEEFKFEELWVEGVYGNKVKTRHDWFEFINWFGDTIDEHPEVQVIDATEGGAKIRGTKIMSLKEAVETYCVREFDCKSLNKEIIPAYSEDQVFTILEYIKNSKLDLEKIKTKANEAITSCDKMIHNCEKKIDENKASQNLVKKISKANKFIINKPIYSMIDSYITASTSANMRDIYQVTEDSLADKITTFVQGKQVYQQIVHAADEITKLIENKVIADKLI